MHLQWVSLLFAISTLQFLFFTKAPKKKQKTKKRETTKKTRPNKLHLTPSPWGVQSCFFFVCLFFWFLGFLLSWFVVSFEGLAKKWQDLTLCHFSPPWALQICLWLFLLALGFWFH